MQNLVEIVDNELCCTVIVADTGRSKIRYTLVNGEWVRAKDKWQLFFTGIRPKLSQTTATTMLLSQSPEAALTRPLTEWLISEWCREVRANYTRGSAAKEWRNAFDHL